MPKGEKREGKKLWKYIWIGYAIFSIIIVIYLVDRLICKDIMNVSNRMLLNNSWNVTVNDDGYQEVDITSMTLDGLKKGDKIIMETQIPNQWDFGEAVLCIHNRHTTLSMYVDNVLEYEYGQDRIEKNKATGSGYLLINFYEEYKGKTLRLEYTVTENNAFSKFDEVFISEWGNSYRYIITQNRVPMLIGSFLIVLGLVMTMVLIFAVMISSKYINVLCLAIFSICIGIWTLCYYNVIIVFSIPLYSISLMEYMSLFLAPIPILVYMYTFVKGLKSKITTMIYNVTLAVQIVLSIVTILLHTMDIVHGAQMLLVFQGLFSIEILFASYVLYKNAKNNNSMKKFTLIGLLIVVVCILYELIYYSVMRYIGIKMVELKGLSSAGFTMFIGILILDLYQKVCQSMMEEKEKAILIKRAYTDELTQIHNRAYCSEIMHKIDDVKKRTYTVINFDLNGLKKVNDTYGHARGDELIRSAAFILNQVFSSEGVVGRMGGDEFIVIIEKSNRKQIEYLIEKLHTYVEETNKQYPYLELSISYGYATSEELQDESIEKVYQLADKRMYEYKRALKLKEQEIVT